MPITDNPMFWILEAAPERYLKTSSATALVILKAIEGFAAFFLCFRILAFLIFAFEQGFSNGSVSLFGLLETLFPKEFIRAVTWNGSSVLEKYLTGNSLETNLTLILGICILVSLVCLIIESVTLIFLRFRMEGAGFAKQIHKVIFFSAIGSLILVLCLAALVFYNYFTGKILSDLLFSNLRTLIILVTVIIVLIGLRLRYHKAIVTILTTIEYELNMGYKETAMAPVTLTRFLFFFVAVCFAAAVIYIWKEGFMNLTVLALALQAAKYIVIGNCWSNFQRRHM